MFGMRMRLMRQGRSEPPAGYTWLLFHGQKVYFNGEPVFVRKEQ